MLAMFECGKWGRCAALFIAFFWQISDQFTPPMAEIFKLCQNKGQNGFLLCFLIFKNLHPFFKRIFEIFQKKCTISNNVPKLQMHFNKSFEFKKSSNLQEMIMFCKIIHKFKKNHVFKRYLEFSILFPFPKREHFVKQFFFKF